MTYLLDVNVLIALADPRHVAHETARDWFDIAGSPSFATCPITENGLVRILGNPRYPNSLGSPAAVSQTLKVFHQFPGHEFWADDISIVGPGIDRAKIGSSAHVTDIYLLALARTRGGRLATFDRRLPWTAVEGGHAALHVIESRRQDN